MECPDCEEGVSLTTRTGCLCPIGALLRALYGDRVILYAPELAFDDLSVFVGDWKDL